MTTSLADVYASAVHDHLRLFANWPIGTERRLGDYGYLDGDIFVQEGNLFDDPELGIALQARTSPAEVVFRFKSAGVSVSRLDTAATGSVAAPGEAKASVSIQFERGNSVYFRSIKLRHLCIDNLPAVNAAILARFAQGKWDGSRVIVQGVFASEGTTILVSSKRKASIQIDAALQTNTPLDLADASAGLSVRSEKDVGLTAVAATGLSPLMTLAGVRPNNRWLAWLGLAGQRVRPLTATQDAEPNLVELLANPRIARTSVPGPELASELGKPVEEVFQVVELD